MLETLNKTGTRKDTSPKGWALSPSPSHYLLPGKTGKRNMSLVSQNHVFLWLSSKTEPGNIKIKRMRYKYNGTGIPVRFQASNIWKEGHQVTSWTFDAIVRLRWSPWFLQFSQSRQKKMILLLLFPSMTFSCFVAVLLFLFSFLNIANLHLADVTVKDVCHHKSIFH